ncbi:MAG: hypothetical protein Q9P01_07225 [Anaerolineae bacterium]|nr:hypothetical protein [Anaerolineae bacterium]MDQ7034617.1 hypothetical protein [Anaerolineae bacterium]
MYVDIWRWCREYDNQARREGHQQKQQLMRLLSQAERYKDRTHFDAAIDLYGLARRLAITLHEPCWELLFESLLAETHIYYRADKKTGLDIMIRAATRSYQAAYQTCLMRARVLCNLAILYFQLDFFGYEDKIREMLDIIQSDIPLDEDSDLRMRQLDADFDFEHDYYASAKEKTLLTMAQSHNNVFRMQTAYHVLHRLAFAEGDIALALDYARETEVYALKCVTPRRTAEAILWQANYERRLQTASAWQTLSRGMAYYRDYDIPRAANYYSAVCDYYEEDKQPQKALDLRRNQLQSAPELGSVSYEIEVHIDLCRLLGRMDLPLDEALQEARLSTNACLKPTVYLQRLQAIENGDYYEYEWQQRK